MGIVPTICLDAWTDCWAQVVRVRLQPTDLTALDTELTQMMVEVLIHQHRPLHWSQRAEKEVRMLRAYPGPTRCKAVDRFTQPLPLHHEVPFVRHQHALLCHRISAHWLAIHDE